MAVYYYSRTFIMNEYKKEKKELAKLFAKIGDAKMMAEVFERIFTPAEYEEIARRLQIFKLLNDGKPQREVAKELGVSIGTVSRGARELKYGGTDFDKIFDL